MESIPIPPAVDAMFAAMNIHDADAAAAVVTPDIEIVMGPHVMTGVDVIREFALQEEPELDITVTPTSCHADGNARVVTVHRTFRWRSGVDPHQEEDLVWTFVLDQDGRIAKATLS